MRMSDFTVCSREPYKSPGFHFNWTSFRENTHSFNDTFHHSIYQNMVEKVSAVSMR